MKLKLITTLKYHWSKILSVFIFIILLGAYANIFAIGSPYSPGSTLNPECAPGEENCTVDLGSGGSSPWLTSTGGIYYNSGSVSVGNESVDIVSSIAPGSTMSSKTTIGNNDIIDGATTIKLNNDGNPVIVYGRYNGPDIKVVVAVCSDPICSDINYSEIDTGEYHWAFYRMGLAIDSSNIPHILKQNMNTREVVYIKCGDDLCSSSQATTVFTSTQSVNITIGSLALDSNDNPYITFNYAEGGVKKVGFARYTGTGTETTCLDNNWRCRNITSYGEDNSIVIDSDGLPRIAYATGEGWYTNQARQLHYIQCLDADCNTSNDITVDAPDLPYKAGMGVTLALTEDDEPRITYALGDSNNPTVLKYAYYVGGGNGIGCNGNSDWSCVQIYDVSSRATSMSLNPSGFPRVLSFSWYSNEDEKLVMIDCLNESCSFKNTSVLDDNDGNYDTGNYSSIVLDERGQAYISYYDDYNTSINFLKETISNPKSFVSQANSIASSGDLGVKGDLFLDGDFISQGSIYLANSSPESTRHALYNSNGYLYWNGEIVNTGPSDIIVSTSKRNTETWLGYDPEEMQDASTHDTVFIGYYTGVAATDAYGSNFIGRGAGYAATNARNSNFFGYSTGANAINAEDSTFIGMSAGGNATNASNSIFIGELAGASATNASNSIFLGK